MTGDEQFNSGKMTAGHCKMKGDHIMDSRWEALSISRASSMISAVSFAVLLWTPIMLRKNIVGGQGFRNAVSVVLKCHP